ncbi:MAG TPA: response regulator, partial [Leptospiraceae bacterium]|nr:response regulator [Leptospiraceae bacterium]
MKKIIVIDDSETYLEKVKDILELEEGYHVMTCSNAPEGLEKIRSVKPDLIISDIDMPEMDGYELFHSLKQDSETELCPVIFLTAKNTMEDLRYGMGLGVDDYIVKPFKAEDLLSSVRVRLSRSSRMKLRLNRSDAEKREYKDLKNDLMIAKQTQEGFLPSKKKKFPGIDFDYSYSPLIDIGGDFFSITELSDGRVRVFISDALGHGISASIFNMAIKVEYD